jgi:hypothetical protein
VADLAQRSEGFCAETLSVQRQQAITGMENGKPGLTVKFFNGLSFREPGTERATSQVMVVKWASRSLRTRKRLNFPGDWDKGIAGVE